MKEVRVEAEEAAAPAVPALPRASPLRGARWVWCLLLLAGIAAVAAFLGYGQAELLLEAANLRYCG